MTKKELRSIYKEIRNKVENKELKSQKIVSRIISSAIYKEAKVVALYMPINNEVDLTPLIDFSIENNKKVCLPLCINDRDMVFKEVKDINALKKGKFDILEPSKNDPTIEGEEIDLMLIPLLAYDEFNNRLGYGKGYYDKYLNNNKNTIKVGIAYKEQRCNNFCVSSHDVPLDFVITD